MSDSFPYDVFLSYSAQDKPVVAAIAERLRADGLRVWFDDWEIGARAINETRQRKIEEGLEQSRVLVLCMSANAFGSDWGQLGLAPSQQSTLDHRLSGETPRGNREDVDRPRYCLA